MRKGVHPTHPSPHSLNAAMEGYTSMMTLDSPLSIGAFLFWSVVRRFNAHPSEIQTHAIIPILHPTSLSSLPMELAPSPFSITC